MAKITRALISVSDKSGIIELGQALRDMGVEILSTGGTAKALRDAGIEVKDVSEHTGSPEMMDGRVKTLHPKVHGGLLGRRDKDAAEMKKHGIEPIDMVVVNLYPFEQTISKPDVTFEDAIENIDIGGPTMLRSSAKNHKDVTVIVDPEDYALIIVEMRESGGSVSAETNTALARKVFEHTARYDSIIAGYLLEQEGASAPFPEKLTLSYTLSGELRYGENPHQRAAAYIERHGGLNLFDADLLQGREMSFNNYLDAHSALMLALEFERAACAIIKHNNPCGAAIGEAAEDAYEKAFRTDPASAFGGVMAFNCPVDGKAAKKITRVFAEVVIAADFDDEAIAVFGAKPNIRLLKLSDMRKPLIGHDIKRVAGGILLQAWDTERVNVKALRPVTKRAPSEEELEALEFAWRVVKHVKSNAIVYADREATRGIGMGQTSRVAAAKSGAINATDSLSGTVVASDGFFPFTDGIDNIKRMGVTAVIQPGGSIKDKEVIASADELGLAMLFTDVRHFRH